MVNFIPSLNLKFLFSHIFLSPHITSNRYCTTTFVPPGKDITTKLYSLNEQLGVSTGMGTGDIGRAGSQDVWRGVVQRSMSLDTVHTGTKGFVRSLAWRASHRRTSASLCDSASELLMLLLFLRLDNII